MPKYKNNQIVEMICQVRFPTILRINNESDELLSKFQDKIKSDFNNYKSINENVFNVNMKEMESKIENITPQIMRNSIKNHMFYSDNEKSKVNLTSNFLSVTFSKYECWSDFQKIFMHVLDSFCEIYNVNNFNRIGIRYVNAFSKKELNIDEEDMWNKYLDDTIVGLSLKYTVKVYNTTIEIPFEDNTQMRIIAGLGEKGNVNSPNSIPVFIIDKDTYELGSFIKNEINEKLDNLHKHNSEIFEALIKDELRNKMGVIENDK